MMFIQIWVNAELLRYRLSPVLGNLGSAINKREAFVKEKAVGYLVAMLQPDVLHPSWSPGAGLPVGWVAAWQHSRWVASSVLGMFASSAQVIAHLSACSLFLGSISFPTSVCKSRRQAKNPQQP